LLYNITWQNFLIHAIDHFSKQDLIEAQYVIISGKMPYGGLNADHIAKCAQLYPPSDILLEYSATNNPELFKKSFLDYLGSDLHDDQVWIQNTILKTILNLHDAHWNVILICDKSESLYLSTLTEFIQKQYHLASIDLNELFEKGHVGDIYIDRTDVNHRIVDLRRKAAISEMHSKSLTEHGRAELLEKMSRKDMIRKLKELKINTTGRKTDEELRSLLIDGWVKDE